MTTKAPESPPRENSPDVLRMTMTSPYVGRVTANDNDFAVVDRSIEGLTGRGAEIAGDVVVQ